MKEKPPVQKNEIVTGEAQGMTEAGAGVVKIHGFTLFVPGLLPGERARIHVLQVKKRFGFGKVQELLAPSPQRVTPRCPHFGRCGGCTLQHWDYAAQRDWKKQRVTECLERIGGQISPPVAETLGMENPWRYRNKGQFPVAGPVGQMQAGFYAPRSHRLVPVTDCLLQQEVCNRAAALVVDFCNRHRIPAYEEATGTGLLRHILTRRSFTTGELMVCLVANGTSFPQAEALAGELATLPGMSSLVLNTNTERTNVILGRQVQTLWGKPAITETLDGLSYQISPLSFFQVNPVQTVRLYQTAVELARLDGTETVLDLYCGLGSLSLFLARKARQVLGVEIVPPAVEDAKANAKQNGLTNAKFLAGPAEEIIPRLFAAGTLTADAVFVDPPRKGCDPAVLATLLELGAKKLVYVSCDPATLARDVKVLTEGGYRLKRAVPVDQFCQTGHIECVCLLSKVQN